MALDVKFKTVTGNVSKVEELVTAGTIQPGSLCVTSIGDKICLVRGDNTVSVLSNDEHIFESMDAANAYITDETEDVKAGQPIVVKDGDSYKQYIVNPSADGGFEIVESGGSIVTGPVWEEL